MPRLLLEDLPAPPIDDIEGHWVPRQDFRGRKSFGAFECRSCKKVWTSAHAFKAYGQGCKRCNSEFLPTFMWVNTGVRTRVDDAAANPDKPHDIGRCAACRNGDCIVALTSGMFGMGV